MLLANRYFDESFGDYAWREFVHVIIWRMEFFLMIQMDILNEFYIQLQYSACVCIDYNEM